MLPTSTSRPGPRSPRPPASQRLTARAAPATNRKAAAEPMPVVGRAMGANVMTAPKLQLTKTKPAYSDRRPGRRNAARRLAEAACGGAGGRGSLKVTNAPASPTTNAINPSASAWPASRRATPTDGSTMPGALRATPKQPMERPRRSGAANSATNATATTIAMPMPSPRAAAAASISQASRWGSTYARLGTAIINWPPTSRREDDQRHQPWGEYFPGDRAHEERGRARARSAVRAAPFQEHRHDRQHDVEADRDRRRDAGEHQLGRRAGRGRGGKRPG